VLFPEPLGPMMTIFMGVVPFLSYFRFERKDAETQRVVGAGRGLYRILYRNIHTILQFP
jgi:hypothetical protein